MCTFCSRTKARSQGMTMLFRISKEPLFKYMAYVFVLWSCRSIQKGVIRFSWFFESLIGSLKIVKEFHKYPPYGGISLPKLLASRKVALPRVRTYCISIEMNRVRFHITIS